MIEKQDSLLLELFKYLKSPKAEVYDKTDWLTKVFNVVRLWSLCFFLALFFATISGVVLDYIGYEQEEFAINELVQETTAFFLFFMVVVVAPFTEEIAFRLGLKFSPLRWGVSIAMLLIFLLLFFDFSFIPTSFLNLSSLEGLLSTLFFFSLVALSITYILKINRINSFVREWFEKYFSYFFYILAILFAFLHIGNYQDDWFGLIHLSPLLVMPQLLLSFAISFFRIYYGFAWAIIVHAINNFVVVCILILWLPLISLEDLEKMNEVEMLSNLSVTDVLTVTLGLLFFFGVILIVILSIVSLLMELVRAKRAG